MIWGEVLLGTKFKLFLIEHFKSAEFEEMFFLDKCSSKRVSSFWVKTRNLRELERRARTSVLTCFF